MSTATSKLTRKYQATIPESIRNLLHLHAGDVIAFEIQEQKVVLRRAVPMDLEFAAALEGTLSEWNSPEDEEAYRDL
jgi:AbrB family looped-hinge helix DNA binding protein